MRYDEHAPSEALRRHVECFWTFTASAGAARPHRVLPDGCMDVIFDLTDATGAVVGAMTKALVVPAGPERVDLLGVRFRPGQAPLVLGPPASESRDARLDLADVWGRSAGELAERIERVRSPRARIELVEGELACRLAGARQDAVARGAVALVLEAGGGLRVDDLSAKVGLGARQLERVFGTLVGVSPRTFSRIVRFRAAADEIRCSASTPRWADFAARHVFYDQAHLIREFRALAGVTPGEYARICAMSRSSNTAPEAVPIFPSPREDEREDQEGDADPGRGRDRAGARVLGETARP